MSIDSVKQALCNLRSSLANSGVNGCFYEDANTPDRIRQLWILSEVSEMFEEADELKSVLVSSEQDSQFDDDGGISTSVSVSANFTFEFEAGGQTHSISLDNGDSVVAEIDEIIDDVCGEEREGEVFVYLEGLKEKFDRLLVGFTDSRRFEMEDIDFWSTTKDFTVCRETYEASMVHGVFDADVFRCLVLHSHHEVADQQRDMTGAPYFWSKASVNTVGERLSAGMDPEACDSNGVLPLVAAATFENWEAAEKLLDAGADPELADITGHNAVSAAIAVAGAEIFDKLIERGARPDGPRMVPTLLVAIAANNGGALVNKLIESGASLHAKMPDGKPFLENFERFMKSKDFDRTRREVTSVIHSVVTERVVRGSLDDAASSDANRKRKTAGMAL